MSHDDGRNLAPLEPSPEQLARAVQQRVLPVWPMSLQHPRMRRVRQLPTSPLVDSYSSQSYRFRLAGSQYRLVPSMVGMEYGACSDPPVELPVHIVSGWHPSGAASTLAECRAAQERLIIRLANAGGSCRRATAMADDLTWFEGALLVSGLTDGKAVDLAGEAGQAAVIRWDPTVLAVLPTRHPRGIAASVSRWHLASSTSTSCPVRRDADPTGRCSSYGGPYVSASIHGAALWQAHRSVAVSLLGCGPCHDGKERIWGRWGATLGSVSLTEEIIGSRYGGYTWR